MSTFVSPTDASAATLARSAQLNDLDSATATAFGLLPDETILKRGRINYAVSTGSANAYLLSLTYAPGSYTDGDEITFKANHANTGASTINVNSLGVKSLRRSNGDALVSGDLPINKDATFRYNSTSGYFEMLSQSAQIATDAATSATAAAASASAASTSETNASASASAASSSASSASTSATNASTSASNASTSATNAASSATTATTQASNASTSATNAASSATTATTKASEASTSASNASTSASNAATSETNAASSATTASNAATALTGTSTTTLTPSLAEKVVTTQSGKSFSAGTFVMMVSDSNAAIWMYGPVTTYSGTTLTFTPTVVGTASAKADWTIAGRVGARGATGATGTGIIEQATGFTATGGTTPKTLTVDVDFTASAAALKTGDDGQLTRQMFKDCGYTVVDKGNINNATVTFDYTAGSVQTYTATGSTVTWAFSNWPPTGNLGEMLIIGTNMGAYTHTISGLTWTLADGTTTTSVATFLAQNGTRTAFQTSGVDKILLVTRDAGTTVYASLVTL